MRLLIGGSPCTYWSCAQTKNREIEASGLGWELFLNYCIAKDKFKPDFFLYENNKSMSDAIRTQITQMLGVEPICINSARVSAQNRLRLYWVGRRESDGTYSQVHIEQPEDRGIMLKDILESGVCWREKANTMDANYFKGGNLSHLEKQSGKRLMVAEPVGVGFRNRREEDGKLYRRYETHGEQKSNALTTVQTDSMVAEPLYVEAQNDLYEQMSFLESAQDNIYAVPAGMAWRGHAAHGNPSSFEMRKDGKSNAVIVGHQNRLVIEESNGKTTPVYEVKDGYIEIKGRKYPIKLADGVYIIRKLSVVECMRLQTVPESYDFPVSDCQAYKMLGNGWTIETIKHLMSYMEGIKTKPLDVLSLYDGMACGHIALDGLGANISSYYATEIDKFAIKTATHNFGDIVELGDAFQVRDEDWALPESKNKEKESA